MTTATACVPTGELTNSQMDGEPIQIREKRGEQGLQRRDAEKDVVVVSFLCRQLSLSLKHWDQSENVCNDFSRTEPDPCAQQSSGVTSNKLPWNSATET